MAKEIKGIVSVLITPYTENNEVDYAGFAANINWQIEKGANAVLVLGGTGEYVSLSKEERFKATEVALDAVAGRIPCIVGVGSEATHDVIAYAQKAEACGADAVMIGHPYYCGADWEMLRNHYKTVCAAINIPVVLYNNPYTTGVDLGLDNELALLSEIPNIEYVKDSTGSIQRVRDLHLMGPAKTKVLAGWEDMSLESLLVGASGWVCVAANACPEICIDMYNRCASGDYAGAWADYEKLLPFLRFLEGGGRLIPATKYAVELRGGAGGPNRAPYLDLTEEQKQTVRDCLATIGVL